ncbi:MAG TPA: conjugal transfer protein TraO [Dysgonomonas sp.]|uniref:conjugal transfer protein TraO n=1 Tax=unclassified Dysgonomonas TaxID=2630389 RepID=UPI0025B9A989|nr:MULTISPECIES: conjugal transfer protein TraO [unclassified Dysgonomonas]HML65210.1 conjugal transfer protein TraO [Dysgonomonas sp.]
MRVTILITVLCLALFGQAHAQRYLPGMRGIQVTAGVVDGFKLGKQDGQAFCFGAAMTTYTKNGNRWVFGGEYLQKNHQYGNIYIPVSQFTAEAGHYFKFISDKSKTFFLSLGVSLLGGYEIVNWGEGLLKDGTTIQNEDNFIYGGAITLESETYLTDRIVLIIATRERFLPSSSVSDFHFQLNMGVKFIIN